MVFLVGALWILMTFEIDQYLTARIGGPFYRLPLLLAPFIAFGTLSKGDKRATYWPLILFIMLHLGASFLAANAGMSRGPLKFMIYMLILFMSSVAYLDSPARATLMLKFLMLSYVWFGVQGINTGGRVVWHSLFENEDSYGPLMVILMPLGFFFAQATTSRLWRWIGRAAFALAILGIIVSFARGAALSAALVLLFIFVRTPNKIRTFAFIAVAGVILLPLAGSLVSINAFTAEIASSGQGDPARSAMWKLAWLVFKSSPIVGVGAGNFGVVGAELATPAILKQLGAGLYGMAVHSSYFQILCEEGMAGIALWTLMTMSIFGWNRHLRTKQAQALWAQRGGAGLDLRIISLGLDGATIGFLATGLFYNQLYVHWIWSLLTMSRVLYCLTQPARGTLPGGPRSPAPTRRARLLSA